MIGGNFWVDNNLSMNGLPYFQSIILKLCWRSLTFVCKALRSAIYGFAMSAKYSNGVSIMAARMKTHGIFMQIFYVSTILLPLANPAILSYLMDKSKINRF